MSAAPAPVTRVTLAEHVLAPGAVMERVEVRRISIAPDVHPGAHWHNGPVFGVIERGSVHVQVGDGPERILTAGDTFFEPADVTITRFDATDEGVTFLAWFPVSADVEPELTMGPGPTEAGAGAS